MSTYAVSGATGRLGRLVVEALLDSGVPASDVVAVVRTASKAKHLIERGVMLRTADYNAPETLPAALAGVDVLLLVSGSEVGQRVTQHANVIQAAKTTGVKRVIYTSVLRADTSPLILAPEHKATEELLKTSGLTYTILRNGWYTENYTDHLPDYLKYGEITGATRAGRVAAAPRIDYAAAAAAVLTGDGHENRTYELGGPPFTMKELAATITDVTGTDVVYYEVSSAELISFLQNAGLDHGTAQFVAALDEATARGDLDTDRNDLTQLIGRPTTTLAKAVLAAI